jgi:trimeric autotransporter adhesin
MKTTIRNSIRSLLLVPLVIACFGLLPAARAVVPAPDGGYPGNNTAEGSNALFSLTIGINNTAVGANALFHDTTGGYNAAFGSRALENNISGNFNMAVGTQALFNNTADANMAVGFRVLYFNTTGHDLTGIGTGALYKNTNGIDNTAIGSGALNSNTTGDDNTAVGRQALLRNTSTSFNVAVGDFALASFNGTTAFDGANTALGSIALSAETSGEENTAVGRRALEFLTAGSNNTAVGWRAGDNVATASGVVCIGSGVVGANVSNTTYIRNINTTTVTGAGTDFVNVDLTTGLLGHNSSSRRYKENIKPMDNASEALYRLKPVTYRFKKEINPTPSLEYGLIAEDVANVDPNLAIRDGKGQIESVRYMAVNAMLLNEFLKEHRKVEELEATVAQQQKGMEVLAASLKEQAAQIQKVNAQLEVKKPAPKVVRNNP